MKIFSVSFTEYGNKINRKLSHLFNNDEFYPFGDGEGLTKKKESIYNWCERAFNSCDAIIFIGALGIAVRAISPCIKSKDKDPAVIVIDDRGRYVIPILSGHIGGSNSLAVKTAEFLDALAIITTSTDINNVWAADLWARENGCAIADISKIKNISAALLKGEAVGLVSDFEIKGRLPKNVINGENFENGIAVSVFKKKPFKNTLNIIPQIISVGAGSRKNSEESALLRLFKDITEEKNIYEQAVKCIATIDIKKEEKCMLRLSQSLKKELKLFSAEELLHLKGDFTSSEFVKNTVGVDNVCERAAAAGGGRLIVRKTKGNGVTMAFCIEDWSVCFEDSNGRN